MSTAATSTRVRLLEAARELVDGGEPLSVEVVACAASVSRATAYRTVSGVQELLDELALERIALHTGRALELAERQRDIVSKIEAITVYTVTAVHNDPVLQRALWQGDDGGTEAMHQQARDFIHPFLLAGQKSGEIRSDVDTGYVADWLVDCFVGSIVNRALTGAEARRLFRTFFAPALQPRISAAAAVTSVERVAEQLQRSVEELNRLRAAL